MRKTPSTEKFVGTFSRTPERCHPFGPPQVYYATLPTQLPVCPGASLDLRFA